MFDNVLTICSAVTLDSCLGYVSDYCSTRYEWKVEDADMARDEEDDRAWNMECADAYLQVRTIISNALVFIDGCYQLSGAVRCSLLLQVLSQVARSKNHAGIESGKWAAFNSVCEPLSDLFLAYLKNDADMARWFNLKNGLDPDMRWG